MAEGADIRHPVFARVYHHAMQQGESSRMVGCRRELLDGLHGRVVEVGPGNGPNFPLYPDTVDAVVAVEPEPYLRDRAGEAARRAEVDISVVGGDAEHLPLEDGTVDAVVFCQVLCSVADPRRALAEARRVLRPGGELRVFEHVGARQPVAAAVLKAAEVTFWRRAFGNCHPTRDTLTVIGEARFDTDAIRRFVM